MTNRVKVAAGLPYDTCEPSESVRLLIPPAASSFVKSYEVCLLPLSPDQTSVAEIKVLVVRQVVIFTFVEIVRSETVKSEIAR